jgi:chemotaxis protein MotB
VTTVSDAKEDEAYEKVEPAGVPRRRGCVAPILAVVFLGTTCALGWFVYQLREKEKASTGTREQTSAELERERARAQKGDADLAACRRERDEHASGHADVKRAAEASRAALDATQAELEELRKLRTDAEARAKTFEALTARFQKMIDAGKLKVMIRDGRMIVKLPERILFPSGSAELAKEGNAAIREMAGILRQFPDRRFMVAGHTDNVPAGGKFKTNWDLSAARAVVVTEQLVAGGMNAAKLVAAGYGPYEPIASNSNEAGRAENRRIEIVLLPNIQELPPPPAAEAPPAASASAHP